MNRFYFIKLALSEFKVHKRRLILTTLAIAWGTITIIILLAFGEGLKIELKHLEEIFSTQDALEGLNSIIFRKKPEFKGK